jgi:integrase
MPTPNRPELALLRQKRTPEALERWVAVFAGGSSARAKSYAEVIARFSGKDEPGYAPYVGRYSPNTRAAYAFAITEFFEWLGSKHGRVLPPHEASRKDAEDYTEWLAKRPYSLEAEKLRDGDQRERLAMYEAVRDGATSLASIAERLPSSIKRAHERNGSFDRTWLHRELGQLVLLDVLNRSPTIAELRRTEPLIELKVFTVDVGGKKVPLEDVFSYSTPKPHAASRSTIALRVTALATFWKALISADSTLVKTNIFTEVVERVSRGLSAERRAARQRRPRLSREVVDRMLRAADGPTLVEKRDAALLWFLVLTAARVTETVRLRRDKPPADELQRWPGWFDGRALPPSIEVVRKGGFHHRLPYPPYALKALHAFQSELERHAPPLGSQSDNPNSPLYVPPSSPLWRYKALSIAKDAPLFPPVGLWGHNSAANYEAQNQRLPDYRKPLNRTTVTSILLRIADKAGLSDEEKAAVHPHAFRHFAATAMARQKKPIREIQQILAHASILTTETYIEDETDPGVLSGQTEILDYLSGAGTGPEIPEPPAERIVETYGVTLSESAASELPAEPPRVEPVPDVHKTGEGLVAVRAGEPLHEVFEVQHGVSTGAPTYAYEGEGGADKIHFTRAEPRGGRSSAETLYSKDGKEFVQQDSWLRENYDPWPLSYGLGEHSLLPWFARGSASKNGTVTVEIRTTAGKKVVRVPPLPVFAGEQLYSEVKAPTLWKKVLELRDRWLRTEPTKAFGLDRWWGAFQEIHRGLMKGTGAAFPWVPFDTVATVGSNIRAHDDDYLALWLEKNADRYTTTVRAFEHIERPRGTARDEEEWLTFQEKFASASLVGVSPAEELPDWFMLDDPVRAIYDASSDEFSWFAKWLGAITGQKLTAAREEDRKAQVDFVRTDVETRIEEARELLRSYFESVESLKNAQRAGEKDEAERDRAVIRLLRDRLGALGVPDPSKEKGLPRDIDARIEKLLSIGFPSADVELVDPNVLVSELFDRDTFRLDLSKKTIVHTEQFQKDFADRYDGRDSECVARRAARGMWEHVKRHGIPVARGSARSSEYSLLYSVMLSYMSWIVPCPEVVEKRMARAGLSARDARLKYLTAFRRASSRVLRTTEDVDEAGLVRIAVEEGLDEAGAAEVLESALVQDAMRAEVALPDPPVTEALARSAIESGNVAVSAARPAIVVTRPGARRRVVDVPKAPVTFYSVGSEDEDSELRPNAPPRRYLTPNALRAGLGHIARADRVMPSPLAMMAAMTRRF